MKQVYMCFSTDIIHTGHIRMIKNAAKLGEVTIGILTDEVVASCLRYPLVPYSERREVLQNITGVTAVIAQDDLLYEKNLRELRPDYVVHSDDWQSGLEKPIRENVVSVLADIGGELIEFPYDANHTYIKLEEALKKQASMPEIRRSRLRKLLSMKKIVRAMEAHNGFTGLLAENTSINQNEKIEQFDAMWISSLCDSTAKGKPDIELLDISSRLQTIDEIMDVTTKPIIFDADTGGRVEHFVYNIRTLERIGVSAVIIEDKKGLKKNSLFGMQAQQVQEEIPVFCEKIAAAKNVVVSSDFMLIARIESLILQQGEADALKRAKEYVKAGADAIMIHSCQKSPEEIFSFCKEFRKEDELTPIVVVPTSYSGVTEEELASHGVNIVIYANQLTRAAVPAMLATAESILTNHCAKAAEEFLMPYQEIIRLIPEE